MDAFEHGIEFAARFSKFGVRLLSLVKFINLGL